MFSSRRAQRTVDPAFDPMSKTPDDKWVGEDPMDEIVRLVEADLAERTRPGILDHDHLAAVIAAELATPFDPMDPVDVTGKAPQAAAAGTTNYDLWDDKALAELPDDFTFDELEPRRVSEGVLPVHPEQDRGPRLARIALIAAVAVGALVAGGGAVWWAFTGTSSVFGEPQLVRAPDGPYKIVPDAGDTIDEPVEGQAIFNQVDGVPPKGEERLVTREETVPELPPVNPQVSRVILPDGQEVAAPQDAVAPVESGPRRVRTVLVKPDGTIIENPETPALRRPTDVAQPGTLDALAAEAAGTPPASLEPIAEPPAPEPAPAEVAALEPAPPVVEPEPEPVAPPAPVAVAPEPVAPRPVAPEPTANDESSSAGLPPIPEAEQTAPEPVAPPPPADEPLRPAATAPEPAPVEPPPAPVAAAPEPVTVPAEPAPAAAVAPVTVPAEDAAPLLPPAPAEAAAPAPTPRIKPAAPRAPAPVAANDGPIDLAAAAAAPAPEKPAPQAQQVAAVEPAAAAAAPAPAGSAFVQVSSQRSEDAALAAFKKMQAKYPNLLGGVSPDVQRADLGAKGIYYRVRVPQPSRAEAITLCEALKSAGADCLIAKK